MVFSLQFAAALYEVTKSSGTYTIDGVRPCAMLLVPEQTNEVVMTR